jgi:hypothetical protein
MKDGAYVSAGVAPARQCTIKETNRKTCLLDVCDYGAGER